MKNIEDIKYTVAVSTNCGDQENQVCLYCRQLLSKENSICPSCHKPIAQSYEKEDDEPDADYEARLWYAENELREVNRMLMHDNDEKQEDFKRARHLSRVLYVSLILMTVASFFILFFEKHKIFSIILGILMVITLSIALIRIEHK